jgi:hypothetical protein
MTKLMILTAVAILLIPRFCAAEPIPIGMGTSLTDQSMEWGLLRTRPLQLRLTLRARTPVVMGEARQVSKSDVHRSSRWAGNPDKFFAGAFVALLGHESGHLIANYALNTHPFAKSVHYGPIPFFTIEPGKPLTNREHYTTASAGFNSQHIINEYLLTKRPDLNAEDEPFLKGMATFNFWLTVGYAATAFAGTGPEERDTKGMADALGWSEESIGAIILVPTALDTYRYKRPNAKWAKTASRLSKLFMIGLAARAR